MRQLDAGDEVTFELFRLNDQDKIYFSVKQNLWDREALWDLVVQLHSFVMDDDLSERETLGYNFGDRSNANE